MTDNPEQLDKEYLLRAVSETTDKIHRLQDEIVETGKQRRKYVLDLRKQNVTYKEKKSPRITSSVKKRIFFISTSSTISSLPR